MEAEATDIKTNSVTAKRTRAGKLRLPSLKDLDGRTAAAQRFRELMDDYTADLGGSPSTAQEAIVSRAVSLQVWCEAEEAQYAQTGKLDISTFTTATNALRRLLSDIGLERRAKDVTPADRIRRQMEGL
jgi:phage host-nuclease inhibitor protein Gam